MKVIRPIYRLDLNDVGPFHIVRLKQSKLSNRAVTIHSQNAFQAISTSGPFNIKTMWIDMLHS